MNRNMTLKLKKQRDAEYREFQLNYGIILPIRARVVTLTGDSLKDLVDVTNQFVRATERDMEKFKLYTTREGTVDLPHIYKDIKNDTVPVGYFTACRPGYDPMKAEKDGNIYFGMSLCAKEDEFNKDLGQLKAMYPRWRIPSSYLRRSVVNWGDDLDINVSNFTEEEFFKALPNYYRSHFEMMPALLTKEWPQFELVVREWPMTLLQQFDYFMDKCWRYYFKKDYDELN